MYQMNLPKIGCLRSARETRAMLDSGARVRVTFHALACDEPDHELIRLAHRMAWAATDRDDETLVHYGAL